AIQNKRKGAGAEIIQEYIDISIDRIKMAINGTLQKRPMNKPKYDPYKAGNKLIIPPW
ncbi:unnamed protein product, partial [marine sediment metagenome]